MESNTLNLSTCLFEAAKNKEFVQQFDRLHGTNLLLNGSVLELEIDKCTGRLNADVQKFIQFVYDKVFMTLESGLKGKVDLIVDPKLI